MQQSSLLTYSLSIYMDNSTNCGTAKCLVKMMVCWCWWCWWRSI